MIRRIFIVTLVCVSLCFAQSANADLVNFDLQGTAGFGLLSGNENPSNGSTSTGGVRAGVVLDTNTNLLTIDIAWGSVNGFSDLTGAVSGLHIHGAAGFTGNAGVLYNLGAMPGFNNSGTAGGFTGIVAINALDIQNLLDGLTYVNVHTASNPGGEIRGNLVQAAIPEPSSAILLVLSCTALIGRRRRV